jgi:hypothetical protein
MTRRKRKRNILIGLAVELIENLLQNQSVLPATIVEARGFGSLLRESPNPHDLDIVFLYRMTEKQKQDWEWFASILGSVNFLRNDDSRQQVAIANRLLRKTLDKYLDMCSLPEALAQSEVKLVAKKIHLNLKWASCFSRTLYVRGEHGDGFFVPRVEEVLHKLAVSGLARRGLQVHFKDSAGIDPTTNRISGLGLVKNFRKIWDPGISVSEIPNRFEMTEDELRIHLHAEFDHFSAQFSTDLSELKIRADEIQQESNKKGLKLDLSKTLPQFDIDILGNEPVAELQEKCEEAREKLRLASRLETFFGFLRGGLDFETTVGPISMSHHILQTASRKHLPEDETRGFMRELGLPEGEFIVLRAHRLKDVIHETSQDIRKEIVDRNARWEKAHRLELRLQKLVPFDRRLAFTSVLFKYDGEIHLTDRTSGSIPKFGSDFDLWIVYDCPVAVFRKLSRTLKGSGWKTDDYQWQHGYKRIQKTVKLSLCDTTDSAIKKLSSGLAPFTLRI